MPVSDKKILIADAQFLTSRALEIILGEKYRIVGSVNSKPDLFTVLENIAPDLIILEFPIYEELSNAEIEKLKVLNSKLLLIADKLNQTDILKIQKTGIENILLKNTDEFELQTAIETCLRGRKYYSEEILDFIIDKKNKLNSLGEPSHLTHTEMEIVRLIADGLTTKQIAAKKFLSFHTVMTHRKNIFRKTAVKSVSELVMLAVKAGWIDNIEYYI